jgi:hypothetical protein
MTSKGSESNPEEIMDWNSSKSPKATKENIAEDYCTKGGKRFPTQRKLLQLSRILLFNF